MRPLQDKIKDQQTLKEIVKKLQREGKRVVFTNGCFDILHRGHVIYLEQARARGDILIVGVNTDTSVSAIKGPARPVVPEKARMTVIAALESVDYVVPFAEPDPYRLIACLKPQILVKGGDWNTTDIVGRDLVKETVVIPFVKGSSTSEIIEVIIQRYAAQTDSH